MACHKEADIGEIEIRAPFKIKDHVTTSSSNKLLNPLIT
jgi:hypothetical protein